MKKLSGLVRWSSLLRLLSSFLDAVVLSRYEFLAKFNGRVWPLAIGYSARGKCKIVPIKYPESVMLVG